MKSSGGKMDFCGIAPRHDEDNGEVNRSQGNIIRYLAKKVPALITKSVGVVILLGSLGLTCLRTAASLCDIALVMFAVPIPAGMNNSSQNEHQNASLDLLKTLSKLPASCVRLRGCLIFLILYWQKDKWEKLRVTLINVAHRICPNGHEELNLLAKWRMRSAVLITVFVTLHVTYEIGLWSYYLSARSKTFHEAMTSYTTAYSPLPFQVVTYRHLITYTIFCILPFLVSQVALSILIIISGTVADRLRTMRREMESEALFRTRATELTSQNELAMGKECLLKKVNGWQTEYLEVLQLVEAMNALFGSIFCVSYSTDCLSFLGLTAGIAGLSADSLTSVVPSFLFLFFSASLFAAYGTLFLIPVVDMHEQVSTYSTFACSRRHHGAA